jgi:hypothetical protein
MVLDDSVMRRSDALREMMRLARTILTDGVVSDAEAAAFQAWIESNPDVSGVAKVEEIVGLLRDAFSDGRLTADERRRLAQMLDDFQGT